MQVVRVSWSLYDKHPSSWGEKEQLTHFSTIDLALGGKRKESTSQVTSLSFQWNHFVALLWFIGTSYPICYAKKRLRYPI